MKSCIFERAWRERAAEAWTGDASIGGEQHKREATGGEWLTRALCVGHDMSGLHRAGPVRRSCAARFSSEKNSQEKLLMWHASWTRQL